ncbi:hypothetical protein AB0M57_03805 [Streptomyces sp. NPDC051597]|uniref:hypothetical protein n=1 Tax=Streptomyces sp. NPDC051597 TaxID=3155049 RepID=UPI00342B8BE4
MLVETDVTEGLETKGHDATRIYAAACVERMAQIFTGFRGSDPGREADVDFFVTLAQRLWDLDDPIEGAVDAVDALEEFQEMQPTETGLTATVDIYCFYSVLALRYAVLCAASGDPAEAVRCGHAILTAMGQMDQNTPGGEFRAGEHAWQRRSVLGDGNGVVDVRALQEGCVAESRERLAALRRRTGK